MTTSDSLDSLQPTGVPPPSPFQERKAVTSANLTSVSQIQQPPNAEPIQTIDEELNRAIEGLKQVTQSPVPRLQTGLDRRSKLAAILIANGGELPSEPTDAKEIDLSEVTSKIAEAPADFLENVALVFHTGEGISEYVEQLEITFPTVRAIDFVVDLFKLGGMSGEVLSLYIEQQMIEDAKELKSAIGLALQQAQEPEKLTKLNQQKDNLEKWIKQKEEERSKRWLNLGYQGTVRIMSASYNTLRFLMEFAPTSHLEHALQPAALSLQLIGASVGVLSSGYQIYKAHTLGQSYEEYSKTLQGIPLPDNITIDPKTNDNITKNQEKNKQHIEKQKTIEKELLDKYRGSFEKDFKEVLGDSNVTRIREKYGKDFEKDVAEGFAKAKKAQFSVTKVKDPGSNERAFIVSYIQFRAEEFEVSIKERILKDLNTYLKTGKANGLIKDFLSNGELDKLYKLFVLQKELLSKGIDLQAFLLKNEKNKQKAQEDWAIKLFPLKAVDYNTLIEIDQLKKATLESYLLRKIEADFKEKKIPFNLDAANEILLTKKQHPITKIEDLFKDEVKEILLKNYAGEKEAIGNRVKNGIRSLLKIKHETEYKFLTKAKIKVAIGFILALAGLTVAIGFAIAFPPSILLWVSVGLGVAGIALVSAGVLYDKYHKPNLTSVFYSFDSLKAPINEFRRGWHLWSLERKKVEQKQREWEYFYHSIRIKEAQDLLKQSNLGEDELNGLYDAFQLKGDERNKEALEGVLKREQEIIDAKKFKDNESFETEITSLEKKYTEAAKDVEQYRNKIRNAAWIDFKRDLEERGLAHFDYEKLFALKILDILEGGKISASDIKYIQDHLGIDLTGVKSNEIEIGELIKDTLGLSIEQLREVFQKSQTAEVM